MSVKSYIVEFENVRDFNTVSDDGTTKTIQTNSNTPDRLISSNSATGHPPRVDVLQGEQITHWKFDLPVDENNEVLYDQDIEVWYSTDNGATWNNFYDDTLLEESSYTKYRVQEQNGVDNADDDFEWMTLVASSTITDPSDPLYDADGTGFMVSKQPLTAGETFTASISEIAAQTTYFSVCFTTGMPIETERGPVAVEDLKIGDMVHTYDRGLQPIRFIYRRKVPALGEHAPVVFEKNALGENERFVVSQKHRISMNTHPDLKAFYGDVLMEARYFVDGTTVRIVRNQPFVEYFHIMFDQHELIWSNGVLSESWQPHKRNLKRDKALREELLSIFPEIAKKHSKNSGGAARETIALSTHFHN